jgi:hypothetical protein
MKAQEQLETAKQHQVFLSYASADKEIAHKIVKELRERNVNIGFDADELQPGDSIAKALEKTISASDYLVVLLSPNSINSGWLQKELGDTFAKDLTSRDITLLPVIVADCELPKFLAAYQYLDLRIDLEHGVTRLVDQISILPYIDFSNLDWISFEALIKELLKKLGFYGIEQPVARAELGFDIKAEYSYSDPFGRNFTETWLAEVKFYSKERASLESIKEFAQYLSKLPESTKGLLITNGHLTSAARNWLASFEAENRLEIHVINGTDLKRLLLQHRDLVEKYFVKNHAAAK